MRYILRNDFNTYISVLLFETVESLLADRTTGVYIDATFGRGGHTRLLLSKLDENARICI